MSHRLLTHTATIGLAVAAMAAPAAVASQDFRSPDAVDAAQTALAQRGQDLRSPDTRDTAAGRGTFTAPHVTVVKVAEAPQATGGGFDWGDAGIGAGAALALVTLAGGGFAIARRHGSLADPTRS